VIPLASTLGALLLSGLVGSVGHCLGMCGPLALLVGVQTAGQRRRWPRQLLFHGARVAMYALLGAVAGGLGGFVAIAEGVSAATGALSVALGLATAALGAGYVGWRPPARLEGRAGL